MAVPALISEVALCLFGNMCLSFLQALHSALKELNLLSFKLLFHPFTGPNYFGFVKNILAWSQTFWTLVKKQSLEVKSHFWSSSIFFLDLSKLINSGTACKDRFIKLPEYNLARNFRSDDTSTYSLHKNRMAAKIAASYRCIYNVIIGSPRKYSLQ